MKLNPRKSEVGQSPGNESCQELSDSEKLNAKADSNYKDSMSINLQEPQDLKRDSPQHPDPPNPPNPPEPPDPPNPPIPPEPPDIWP